MFLKRRNLIAWVLILVASLCWVMGQDAIRGAGTGDLIATTMLATTPETVLNSTAAAGETLASRPADTSPPPEEPSSPRAGKAVGFLMCAGALVAAVIADFFLRQTSPLLGPDGAALVLALVALAGGNGLTGQSIPDILILAALLCAIRELWGWLRDRASLSWCAARRLALRCPIPQLSLLVYCGFITLCALGVFCFLFLFHVSVASYRFGRAMNDVLPPLFTAAAGILGICCLWKYGAELRHFQIQLDHFQQGQPITIGEGAFASTEEKLLQVQTQHEEAIHQAVTSERFKVELIANVSHDLRTPLTSILGYSELLRQEKLSPQGAEQLARLNQKAGYMRDLVESLFELTKVSSGVLECKKEEIDLIRLLEQTIGLFDDQLTAAKLQVRRHYDEERLPIVTDGARMHQVFANLLGNAIKYALPGTRIHLQVRQTPESCTVRMTNIASYEMDFQPEEVLQRFARGDKARSTQGSGLGLAIAQTYTESVGGKFTVTIDGDQFNAIVTLPKTERNL